MLFIQLISRPPRTCKGWLNFFMLKIPILQWVWSYKVNYLIGDIVAGITVAIIVIPQGKILHQLYF